MLSARFDAALAFAHNLHRRQARKTTGVPYVAHLLGVAALVIEDGGSEDESIAALLHDSLEDQGTRYAGGTARLAQEIGGQFGPEVLRIVEGCTERRTEEEMRIFDRRERWRVHKRAYFEQIRTADPSVRRVSCADSLYNVRSLSDGYRRLGDRIWTRFMTRNGQDQVWAYRGAAASFREVGVGAMADELADAVEQLASLIAPPPQPPSPRSC